MSFGAAGLSENRPPSQKPLLEEPNENELNLGNAGFCYEKL